jgi:hypothetical protein
MPERPHRRDPDAEGTSALGRLVGAGPSRVGVGGAMRARDVSRPTDADIALARQRDQARRGGSSPVRS